ncbi:hypothetical protein PIB30_096611, partial [Stylosanthes scabra]|nr:hypothetical protein [Stylosanthes scabra]
MNHLHHTHHNSEPPPSRTGPIITFKIVTTKHHRRTSTIHHPLPFLETLSSPHSTEPPLSSTSLSFSSPSLVPQFGALILCITDEQDHHHCDFDSLISLYRAPLPLSPLALLLFNAPAPLTTTHPFLHLTAGFHNHRRVCLLCSFPVLEHTFFTKMTRNGKTSTKGSAPTAVGSTAGNLSQLLLRSCFRKRTVLPFKCGDAVLRAVL